MLLHNGSNWYTERLIIAVKRSSNFVLYYFNFNFFQHYENYFCQKMMNLKLNWNFVPSLMLKAYKANQASGVR